MDIRFSRLLDSKSPGKGKLDPLEQFGNKTHHFGYKTQIS